MKHSVTAWVAALLILVRVPTAVSAPAETAAPFETVPLEHPRQGSHLLAYASMIAGAGLIAGSFAISDQADKTYDEYLIETNPERIAELYDTTVRYDRLSIAALVGGNLLLAGGLYLRFLKTPAKRVSLNLGPERCVATLRF